MKRIIIGVVFAGLLAWAGAAAGYGGSRHEKARYYYLEGVRHASEGRDAEAYEYYKRAYSIDPDYSEAGHALGMYRITMDADTMRTPAETSRTLQMMRPFVDAYPYDYEGAITYGYIATRIDSLQEAVRVFERTDSLMPERTTTLIHLADAYTAQGDLKKAIAAYDKYERIEGKTPQLTPKKVSYYLSMGDTVSAIAECTSLIESNPRRPEFYILKGNLFEVLSMNDSTEHYYLKAESVSPGSGDAKIRLAEFYRQQGDSAKYDTKTYEALLSEDFGLEEKTQVLAQYLQTLLRDKSNTQRGDYLFSVLENQYPHEPEVLDLDARYSAAKGEFGRAIEKIGYAIDLSPTNATYRGQKMSYQISNGESRGAIETYDEAIKHVEDTGGILKSLCATAAMIEDDYDTTIRIYSEIIRDMAPGVDALQPLEMKWLPTDIHIEELERMSSLYCSIGDAENMAGDTEKAYVAYENALMIDPENAMALNNYAYQLSEHGGDLEKAEEMSRRCLEIAGEENPTYLDTYAWVLYKTGNVDKAVEYQRKAIDKSVEDDSEVDELYLHYGLILSALDQKEEALNAWKRGLELNPENEEIKILINDKK